MKKLISAATQAMLDSMEDAAPPTDDKLAVILKKVAELRDAELSKAEIADRLKAINTRINEIQWTELPQMMDEVGLSSATLKPDGNKPAYSVKVSDHYKANIPDEHREEAFQYLDSVDAGDLVKYQYTVSFGRGEAARAKKFESMLLKSDKDFERKLSVPWNTLTAWFREEYKQKPLSHRTMEILGASVKRVADVVKLKEKK